VEVNEALRQKPSQQATQQKATENKDCREWRYLVRLDKPSCLGLEPIQCYTTSIPCYEMARVTDKVKKGLARQL